MDTPSTDTMSEGALVTAVNVIWLFISTVLVVIMQPGFAAYEVSSTHEKSCTVRVRAYRHFVGARIRMKVRMKDLRNVRRID